MTKLSLLFEQKPRGEWNLSRSFRMGAIYVDSHYQLGKASGTNHRDTITMNRFSQLDTASSGL